MEAGNELDALIAEMVMGEKACFSVTGLSQNPMYKPYSTSISAAWEVVEKLAMVTIENGGKSVGQPEWSAGFPYAGGLGDWVHGQGDTAPHAICLAALRCVGYNIDQHRTEIKDD